MAYELLSSQSENYEGWQRDRASGLTSSELGLLATSGRPSWVKLKAEKQGIAPRWTGNKYTQWGHDREPIIMDFLKDKYGIESNDRVLRNIENPRALGTPDGIHPEGTILGEAKTSKKEPWPNVPRLYIVQAQANMRVTGAEEVVLAVEYFDERSDGSLVPRHFNHFDTFIIARDESEQQFLQDLEDQFYSMGEVTELDALLASHLNAKEELARATAAVKDVEKRIFDHIGEKEKFKYVSDLGSITLSRPKPRATFQKEKFAESYPDLVEQFTLPGSQPKPSLRITLAKESA